MKILKFTISFFFVFLSLISVTSLKISAKFLPSADENTGVSGTIGPNIPEPLHLATIKVKISWLLYHKSTMSLVINTAFSWVLVLVDQIKK
ncbi:MAG: hypothetical protein ACOYK1_06795 [Vampirovibrionia bacterium]